MGHAIQWHLSTVDFSVRGKWVVTFTLIAAYVKWQRWLAMMVSNRVMFAQFQFSVSVKFVLFRSCFSSCRHWLNQLYLSVAAGFAGLQGECISSCMHRLHRLLSQLPSSSGGVFITLWHMFCIPYRPNSVRPRWLPGCTWRRGTTISGPASDWPCPACVWTKWGGTCIDILYVDAVSNHYVH